VYSIFLDYDGTLAPFQKTPSVSSPLPKCSEKLLERLTEDPNNHVFIVSGRTTTDLQEIFTHVLNVSLW
jgi:trehalose 6-phosphate synthase/phosphatase